MRPDKPNHKTHKIRNLTVTCCSILFAPVYFAGALGYGQYGYIYWIGVVTLAFVFLFIELYNYKFLSVKYLLTGRIGIYYTSIVLLSLLLCGAICVVMLFQHNHQPWVFLDIFGNIVIIFLMLLLTGIAGLYGIWEKELTGIDEYSHSVDRYVEEVRNRLNPQRILQWLNLIIDFVQTDAEKARTEIQKLSDYLRHQLYELPKLEVHEITISADIRDSKTTRLLIGKEYLWIRISLVLVIFLLITANVFFIGQGEEPLGHRLIACLVMFAILTVLYAGIRKLFFHALKYTQSLRVFLICSSIITFLVSIPVIAVYVIDSEGRDTLHIIIISLSILLNLGVFIVGTGGLMYIQQWLRNCKRMRILRFMVLQEEYYYLRKQINPHFLFNILNSADLSSYTDSEFSVRILNELRNVLLCHYPK